MIGFFDGERYSNFRHVSDFLDHVCRREYSGWRIFAHYGGKFDIDYIFDWLRANRPEIPINFYCSGSCVVSFTIHVGRYRFRFADSYRLMDSPLSTLTKEFDVEHKKQKFDPSSIEYNRHDCLGLYEVLQKFFALFDLTRETIASQALAVFKTRFLTRPIYGIPRRAEDFVRKGYFGGRVEVYRYDPKRLNKYDVNSLYPFAMLDPVPVEYNGFTTRLPDDDSEIGFYDADVDYPDTYLPVLPTVFSGRLFFPVGKFRGIFSSMELRRAIEDGACIRINGGIIFKAERIFSGFVDSLYRMRLDAEKAGNEAIRYTIKKVLNSLYGKFGQGREQIAYCLDPGTSRLDPMDDDSPLIYPLGPAGSGLAYYFRDSFASHILPHISAAVTSRARLVTHRYLSASGPVWYTDTDSVFTTSKLPTSRNLGALKLEGSERFQAYGLKEYKFGDKWNIKGLSIVRTDPVTGEKTEDPTIAERYLRGERINIQRRAGFLESIRSGQPTVRRIDTFKVRHERVDKRARDGKYDTRPWNAKEIGA